MTNLEKLKSEIAELSAEELAEFIENGFDFGTSDYAKSFKKYCIDNDACVFMTCTDCRTMWLNKESEENDG